MRHVLTVALALGLGGTLAAVMSCAQSLSADACHQAAIEELGCCPACDIDCRETVSAQCAEVHDAPLVEQADNDEEGEDDAGGSSDESTEPSAPEW